jgi:sugar phosphate isomerase/epimerase
LHLFLRQLVQSSAGFNYDHDDQGRLLEDDWVKEWDKVEAHFAQMKKLGANVVRVHLQVGNFMDGPDKANAKALDRLGRLLELAERLGYTMPSPWISA